MERGGVIHNPHQRTDCAMMGLYRVDGLRPTHLYINVDVIGEGSSTMINLINSVMAQSALAENMILVRIYIVEDR